MKPKFLLGLISMASMASTALADITFHVIGYPSTSQANTFGVSIGGAITPLTTNETHFPLWSGTVPGTTGTVQYSYVELDGSGTTINQESFTRQLHDPTATETYNDFFQRQFTKYELPMFPYVYSGNLPSKTKAFKDDQIATIHLTTDATQLDSLFVDPGKVDIKVNFRFINAKTVYSQQNITLGIAGKSSRDFGKQSYKIKFETEYNQTFFSRPNLKLRAMATDPTMIREKIYIDMLNACGIPTQQGAYVRLFINNKPFGLFLMVDDIKKSFIKQTVYGGNPNITLGSLVQMNAPKPDIQADLVYRGPLTADYPPYVYDVKNLGISPPEEPLQHLIQFMADLQAFDPATTPDPIGYFNNSRLELDGFLINMALEYLAGGFDNYWMSGSNYFMYFNPILGSSGKWQWIPTDFDGTFGNGYPNSVLSTYQAFGHEKYPNDRPLVDKLVLQNKEINALFEETLKTIVAWMFKPEGMFPRIDALNRFLQEDAAWDLSLPLVIPTLETNGYTIDDFNGNLDIRLKDMSYALKPWIADRATQLTAQLNFALQPGAENRVPPPTRPKDDDEDTEIEVPSGENSSSTVSISTGFTLVMIIAATLSSML